MTLKSPDILRTSEYAGGNRLNKSPLLFLGLFVLVLFGVVIYTATSSSNKSSPAASKSETFNETTSLDTILSTQQFGQIAEKKESPALKEGIGEVKATPPIVLSYAQSNSFNSPENEQLRQQQLRATLQAPTTITNHTASSLPPPVFESPTTISLSASGNPHEAWLKSQQQADPVYLPHTRTPPLSPYEIKAGTIVPGTLITGINSELPGQIIGQVRENVYDTKTGRFILIPQASRLIGHYSSTVIPGQERVLVVWNRIIYPDGSSVSLQGMSGSDQEGYSGFKDQVDNHYLRTFGNAIFLSLFSAGVQISQPKQNDDKDPSLRQVAAGSLGRQLGELGIEFARRGMNIAPTLEIQPGFKFNVIITKDIILAPWMKGP